MSAKAALPLTIAMLAHLGAAATAQVASWKDVKVEPLRPFQVATPARHVLPNGLTVLLLEDHELPLIDLTLRVRAGGRHVPADKAGLDEVFGEAWRTGGTTARTGDQLDDALEARAAKVESSMSEDAATLSLNCLKGDFPHVLDTFLEVLRKPAFAQDKIDIAKKQVNTGISRRNDDPSSIAQREATKLGYGSESPYARVPEYATVAAITRDDLMAWHGKYVHPNRSFLAVSGDFDPAQMKASIEKAFGSWPRGPEVTDPEPFIQKEPRPGMYFVEKNDVTQAQILMVHLGIRRDNPDLYAVDVLNEILSGSFPSRLFSNIRSKKGLAYAVWGGVFAGYDRPGLFITGMGTKSSTVAAGIDALHEELDGVLGARPVTDEEIKRAKDAILNSFVFRVDSRKKVLNQQLTYAYFGYPPDFLQRYQAGIEKVTKDDVARVAKSHIRKGDIAVLVVGKPADFDRALDTFGKVTTLDITIPELPAAPKAAATGESVARGKELLAKVVEGLGGAAKVDAVKEIEYSGGLAMSTPMGDMNGKFKAQMAMAGMVRQEIAMGPGTMIMVAAPAASFMMMGPQSQEMPGSQRDEMMKEMRRQPLMVAQARASAKLTVNYAGQEKVGDVAVEVLEVSNEGADVRFSVDPATGRVLRAAYRSAGPQGPTEMVSDYTEHKAVDGVWLPHKEVVSEGGKPTQTMTVDTYRINPGLAASVFEKPKP